jgi:methyl-accepting chemotaxis protein
MLKDMKLGLKMALGFGLVILLVITVGVIGIVNMLQIQQDSVSLEERYVPEVDVAVDVLGNTYMMVYEIRGYTYSFDNNFYTSGMRYMDQMDQAIQEAAALSERFPQMLALRNGVAALRTSAGNYRRETIETQDIMNRITQIRTSLDEAAGNFVRNAEAYVTSQNEAMQQQIAAGATQAALQTRLSRISDGNRILDIGNEIRIGNFRAQALLQYDLINEIVNEFPPMIQIIDRLLAVSVQQINLNQLNAIRTAALAYQNQLIALRDQFQALGRINTARIASGQELTTAANALSEAGLNQTANAAALAVDRVQTAVVMMVIGVILALILALTIAMVLTRMITSALNKGVVFAKAMADGDMTQNLDIDQKDEIGQLATAMKDMASKISSVVREVQTGAESVGQGSNEMSFSAQQVAEGATEQAASTEEVSSSMEEMGANIRQNAENAAQTNSMSQKVAQSAQEGGEAVSETVSAMKEIAQKISIIEEIARNTNLLALNAAIEAARAGEQGRGFAVVASEVRKLAERSQKAAGEISELSQRSVSVAEKAGSLISAMIPDINRTAELVQEISVASREQDSGADQINRALAQLDQVIQQNASFSEEMAATAEGLASQAEQLQTAVSFFKVTEGNRKSQKALPEPKKDGLAKPKSQIAHIPGHGSKQRQTSSTSTQPSSAPKTRGIKLDLPVGEVEDIDDNFDEF